jgi:hypothetical protein
MLIAIAIRRYISVFYRCDRLELGPVFGSFSCRLLCFYFYLLQENPAILQPSGNIEQGARFHNLEKSLIF